MIEGIKIFKQVDSAVKSVTDDNKPAPKKGSKDAEKKKKKGRPTCKKDEEEEKRLA